MYGNIYLLGGGEIGNGETKLVDDFILTHSKKDGVVLFIGVASGDSEGYFETFKKVYGINNKTIFITAKYNEQEFAKAVNEAKIIYLGGGSTELLLNQLKKWNASKILTDAIKNGTDVVGMSAGAYVLAKKYLHEENNNLEIREGLGLISATVLVHSTVKKEDKSLKIVELMDADNSFVAISERSALVVSDKKTISIGDGTITRYDFNGSYPIKFAF